KFWMKQVSVGRNFVSRSSLFLNQWLVAATGEDIGPQSTFSRFKSWVEQESGRAMQDLLVDIKVQATQYEDWTLRAKSEGGSLEPASMAFYRMDASGVEALKPLVIWLHAPSRALSDEDLRRIIQATESWMYRRQILRLSNSDLGRIVADIIAANEDAPDGDLHD